MLAIIYDLGYMKFMNAHVTIKAINHNQKRISAKSLNAFEQEMQDYQDNADTINKPSMTINADDVQREGLSRYSVRVAFLNDEQKETLEAQMQQGAEKIRMNSGAHFIAAAVLEDVDYDAPKREEGQMFSLTYFLSTKQDVTLFCEALEQSRIVVDNQDAVNIWRGMIDRGEEQFNCVAQAI
jgi:hypothetical protein